jgi:hypothetical protein
VVASPASDTSGGRASRQHLLERALLAVGAVALGTAVGNELAADAAPRPSRKQDVRILNFLLLLERLQEGLYAAASSRASIHGELRQLATVAHAHERAHVQLLERALGSEAAPKPSLRFDEAVRSPRRFVRAALRLEETATAATIGEAANLSRARVLDAARIVSVDARHAAWIRDVARELPAPRAADPSQTAGEVERYVRGTGYVVRG